MTEPITSDATAPQPNKKRRVFMWVFLAVQVFFIVWIVAGVSGRTAEDCGSLSRQACQDATAIGTGIGIFLVIMLWALIDIILGITYLVYKVARR